MEGENRITEAITHGRHHRPKRGLFYTVTTTAAMAMVFSFDMMCEVTAMASATSCLRQLRSGSKTCVGRVPPGVLSGRCAYSPKTTFLETNALVFARPQDVQYAFVETLRSTRRVLANDSEDPWHHAHTRVTVEIGFVLPSGLVSETRSSTGPAGWYAGGAESGAG